MATLGSLLVSLELQYAKFQSDVGKAARAAEGAAKQIQHSFEGAKSMLEGFGAALGLEKIYEWGEHVIESTAKLQMLKAQTGLSVEALSALAAISKRTGLEVDTMALSFDRMQKNAYAAAGGNNAATKAFKAIGISVDQVKEGLKDPDQFLKLVATDLEQFTDDGNKAAIMQLLFGRGGAQMAEALHMVAQEGYGAATATAEQAEQAHAAAVALADWKTEWEAISRTIVIGALPMITKAIAGVRFSFTALMVGVSDTWARIVYATKVTGAAITDEFKRMANNVAGYFDALPFKWAKEMSATLRQYGSTIGEGANKALDELNSKLAFSRTMMKTAAEDYVATTTDKVTVFTGPRKKTLGTFASDDSEKALRAGMQSQLKIIDEAMKTEEQMAKLFNTQLDQAYETGAVSLAEYSAQKADAIDAETNAMVTGYNAQIAIIQKLLPSMQKQEDHEAALARIEQLGIARDRVWIQNAQQKERLETQLIADGQKYAKSILDVTKAYDSLIGNTSEMTAIQIEEDDAMLRATLIANQNADALSKLDAVERDRMLNSSKKGTDGMIRAMRDYGKAASDVASQVQQVAENSFRGIEDGIIAALNGGKDAWRDFANSVIQEIERIIIKQALANMMSSLIGGMFGMAGGAAGSGGAGSGAAAGAGSYATGGAVSAGQGYMVGEAGPEWFTPNSAGTITPNDKLGGGGVVYSPTIQIDSRADQAQVRADVRRAIQQGQRDLVKTLIRYNPQLRV